MKINRRPFLKAAAAIGASLAWVGPAQASRVQWHERRAPASEDIGARRRRWTGDLIDPRRSFPSRPGRHPVGTGQRPSLRT